MTEDRSVLSRHAAPPDEVVRYGPEPEHVADVRYGRTRAAERPLLFHIHGGFWRPETDRAHTAPTAVALAEHGWTVAAIEYRRVPGRPELTIHDVTLALRSLPSAIGSHSGRVILSGHSAGGHLALLFASLRLSLDVVGALALAPVADLVLAHELQLGREAVLAFLGGEPFAFQELDPKRGRSPEIPVTIVHGGEDAIVPISLAESYVATHKGARLVPVAGAGHFAVIDPLSGAWPVVVRELERLTTRPIPA